MMSTVNNCIVRLSTVTCTAMVYYGYVLVQVPSDATEFELREAFEAHHDTLAGLCNSELAMHTHTEVSDMKFHAATRADEPVNILIRDTDGSLVVRK